MGERIYGVIGAGIVPKAKIRKYRRRGAILWRQTGGKMEVWNYKHHQWVEMTMRSIPINELMKLAGT